MKRGIMSAQAKTLLRTPALLAIAFVIACVFGLAGQGSAYAATDDAQTGGLTVGTAATVKVLPRYGDDALNTTGAANVRTVYRFGWISGGNNTLTNETSKSYDVTGDGWADTIKVVGTRTSKTSGYLNKIRVTVNGKGVAEAVNYTDYIDRALVSVVTLKNKQPFLWVDLMSGSGKAVQKLFQYKNGKFKVVLTNKAVAKRKTSNHVITYLAPEDNKINVTFDLATTATGITRLKYAYVLRGNKLTRTTDRAISLSYATNDNGVCTSNQLTAAGTFKVYSDSYLDEVAFTVKAGTKVRVTDAMLKGKKLLYEVRLGNKKGWMACPAIKRQSAKAPKTLFYETYGKVNLYSAIPVYSAYKKYTAKQLQQFNDHALYVARNEIYAHHGYSFTNGELRSRFMYKSWYKTLRTPLNATEQANADLILAIERNRNSLYAV